MYAAGTALPFLARLPPFCSRQMHSHVLLQQPAKDRCLLLAVLQVLPLPRIQREHRLCQVPPTRGEICSPPFLGLPDCPVTSTALSLPFLDHPLPFLDLSLPFPALAHYLSLPFHYTFTALPWHSKAFPGPGTLPFLALLLPFHCPSPAFS